MSHRHRLPLAIGFCWSMLLGVAHGEAVIPGALKAAPAIDPASEALIRTYVKENAAKLLDASPDVVSKARDALGDGGRGTTGEVSAAYGAKYAELVNAEILSILGKVKAIRPRLNAAIAAARVAEGTRNTRLEPVALKLLEDAQLEVLKLWGLRTARGIMPELIKIGAHQKLLDCILATVKQHPTGAVTHEVYEVLTAGTDRKAVAVVMEPLLALAQTRVKMYQSSMPDEPERDATPLVFLLKPGIWDTALTPAQRVRVLQIICDLLTMAAARGDDPTLRARDQIVLAVDKVLQSVSVAGSIMGAKTLEATADKAHKDAKTATAKLTDAVKPVIDEIKRLPGCQKIEAPRPTSLPTTTNAP